MFTLITVMVDNLIDSTNIIITMTKNQHLKFRNIITQTTLALPLEKRFLAASN